MLMSRAKFASRFDKFEAWQKRRNAAQHVSMWQSDSALSVLDSLDQHLNSGSFSFGTHDRQKQILVTSAN